MTVISHGWKKKSRRTSKSSTTFRLLISSFNLASVFGNRYLSIKDANFVDDLLTDLSDYQQRGNSYRVLLFPPLGSYNRLLIHKTVESEFCDLVTFSIGAGASRRTVVAFREACVRGPKGIQLMDNPIPPSSKGRGRGRGKDLSASERVARWVNQREAKRLNKERWANRESEGASPGDRENDFDEDTGIKQEVADSEASGDRSKSKRQVVQLYVPPSLRKKKASSPASVSGSGGELDENFSQREQESPVDASGANLKMENVSSQDCSHGAKAEHDSSSHMSVETSRPKGRGRGRKKPEVEIYVPRALRAGKQDSKPTTKTPKDDQGPNMGLQNTEKVNKFSDSDDLQPQQKNHNEVKGTDNKFDPLPSDARCSVEDVSRVPYEVHNIPPPLTDDSIHEKFIPDSHPPEIQETVTQQSYSDNGIDPFTFEFYDPAVVAFMPSAQTVPQLDNNNSAVNCDAYVPSHISHMQAEPSSYAGDQMLTRTEGRIDIENIEMDARSDEGFEGMKQPDCVISASYPPEDQQKGDSVGGAILSVKKQRTDDRIEECSELVLSSSSDNDGGGKPLTHNQQSVSHSHKPQDSTASIHSTNPTTPHGVDLHKSEAKDNGQSNEHSQECADDEDTWDALFDDNGDCLDDSLVKELTEYVGKVEIDKPKINYLNYEPKEPELDLQAFRHIIEIYDFSPDLATCDLMMAFREFSSGGFDVKWVDDTHALGVFSSAIAANEALKMVHPLLKVRPMSEASKKGQSKARHCQEFLQPYKARPETTSIAARRLVAGALGMAPRVSKEVREQERKKLKEAKEKRKQERQQKIDIWDGSFGKCAMDEEDSGSR